MDFLHFLQKAKTKQFWETSKVICFNGGSNYPSLFFVELLSSLESKGILPADRKSLMLGSVDKQKMFASLQQSFLGQFSFYWLSLYECGKTERGKSDLFTFLMNYKGPHFVSFYLNSDKIVPKQKAMLKNVLVIDMEEQVDFVLFEKLLHLFNQTVNPQKLAFVRKIFKHSQRLFRHPGTNPAQQGMQATAFHHRSAGYAHFVGT